MFVYLESEDFHRIMEKGWNINIECKGKGREYEMTFEATATKVVSDDSTTDDFFYWSLYPIHAVHDNLKSLLAIIYEKVLEKEKLNKRKIKE